MDKVVETLAKTPLPTILVVAGIVFLFLAIGGQLGARFSTERLRPLYALVLGLILLACGIWLQLSSPKAEAAREKERNGSPSANVGAPRPDSYALRRPAVKGTVIRTTTRLDWPEMAVSLEKAGKYSNGTLSLSNEKRELAETVAVENGHATVMRVKILSDSRSSTLTLEGTEPSTQIKKGPLEGATILIELKNGRWAKTLIGGMPNKEQKEELTNQFVDPDEIYPTEKVSLGYSWQLKDNQLLYFFPDALSVAGNAWCKFKEMEVHQDQQCAVVSSRIEIVARTLVQNEPAEFNIGANATTYRRLDKSVDIESSIDGQMTARTSWIADSAKTVMEISGLFHSVTYNADVTGQPDVSVITLPQIRLTAFARSERTSLNSLVAFSSRPSR